jgi:glycosyltransferase involved in cell wall biosynthesis
MAERAHAMADGQSRLVFVSWTDHARAEGLAGSLGAHLYVPARSLSRAPWPVRYLAQAVLTLVDLLRRRPTHVLFTNPPFLAGLPILAAARLIKARVWCDVHSGAFNDDRWSRFALANRFVLARCDGVVFANARLAREVAELVRTRTVVVASPTLQERPSASTATPTMVATLGWAFDEPIDELLDAIRRVPEISVTLTGRAPGHLGGRTPANCTAPGWLPYETYHDLIGRATAVICLTTRESTMQTGAYEALEHGTPMILSGTAALREQFAVGGVVFVDDHRPATLARAMRQIVSERREYRRDALAARTALSRQSRHQCEALRRAMLEETGG